jgi:LacI family transcriptional regulator
VPRQVSITGIDNTRPAQFVGLTTVSVPLHEMGRRAAHAVLGNPAHDEVLPHKLAVRGTTAPR